MKNVTSGRRLGIHALVMPRLGSTAVQSAGLTNFPEDSVRSSERFAAMACSHVTSPELNLESIVSLIILTRHTLRHFIRGQLPMSRIIATHNTAMENMPVRRSFWNLVVRSRHTIGMGFVHISDVYMTQSLTH